MDHDVIDLEEQRKKEKHYVKQSERISRPTEQQSSMEGECHGQADHVKK
jgi:hypothetical protein